ncbi:Uma2 family endonuclease [Salinibacter ruber]|uniref:Uma2 family endonuclease n=1 Tax=Salinibacter ruber TaxID=146919 RepID=UPI002168B1B0|nr:Uma2 family endonuclease [Salinibacter ruber]MCS3940471.1 Uma2 family endonuclease [Salinibacter ruber]
MPTTARAADHQERWHEIISDPGLRELPYTVETNHRGQIVLSPRKNRHSVAQEQIQGLLDEHAPNGLQPTEFAIATAGGVKVADVIWMSPGRWEHMQETGDPSTLAPEICVEVMPESNDWESNDWDEMHSKRTLYLEAGAEEVWVVTEEGAVRFFADEETKASGVLPGFPEHV